MGKVRFRRARAAMGIRIGRMASRMTIGGRNRKLTCRLGTSIILVGTTSRTVGIRIEPSLILTPEASYKIDPERREAGAVIFEGEAPNFTALEIAVPRNGFVYPPGDAVTIIAELYSTQTIGSVNFYADNQVI